MITTPWTYNENLDACKWYQTKLRVFSLNTYQNRYHHFKYDVTIIAKLKMPIFSEILSRIENVGKSSKYLNFTEGLAYKRRKWFSFFKFTQKVSRPYNKLFPKWWVLLGGNHPITIIDDLPYPTWKVYPRFFFHQNDCKWCTLDYLDSLGAFLLGFMA